MKWLHVLGIVVLTALLSISGTYLIMKRTMTMKLLKMPRAN